MEKVIAFIFFSVFPFTQILGQIINTVAGNGMSTYTGDGGPAALASIGYTGEIVHDRFGNYYFLENNSTIRMINASGVITTIAGTGVAGFSGDGGLATAAQLNQPVSVAVDTAGNIYVSDKNNHRIRRIDFTTKVISTVAGNGTVGFSGDGGIATAAQFNYVYGIAVDTMGNLFVVDYLNYRIRKISPAGIITTVVGTGIAGHTGDGASGVLATLGACKGLLTDKDCNLYICDESVVRKLDAISGNITRVAGNGIASSSGDGGSATSAGLNNIVDLAINTSGELYICDMTNNNIRKVNVSGVISTVAGTGTGGYNGDGIPATTARLWVPRGVSVDDCDNLYISDNSNSRIRKVTYNSTVVPIITIGGTLSAAVGTTVTVSAAVSNAGSIYTIKWFKNSVHFSTTNTPFTSYVKGVGADTITAQVVPAVLYCYDSTSSSHHIVNEGTVGVPPLTNSSEVSIYPNPVNTYITIVATVPISSVFIVNMLGRQMYSCSTSLQFSELQVDVAHLPPGVYMVRVNGVWVRRFLKE